MGWQAGHRQVEVGHHRDRPHDLGLELLTRCGEEDLVAEERLGTVEGHLAAERPEVAEPAARVLDPRVPVHLLLGAIGGAPPDQIDDGVGVGEGRVEAHRPHERRVGA